MPLCSHASRPSKLSHRDDASIRVRPSPRSSNTMVSSATPSGSPSYVNVCTMRSGRISWKQPRKANSAPSASWTNRQLPPVRASHWSILVVMPFGPTHWTKRSGSVCARSNCAGVALKSRVMRMTGTFGSASMVASAITFIVVLLLLVAVHRLEYGVETAVALFGLAPIALDPAVHQVEDLRLQVHRRSEEHTSELQSRPHLVCRLLLEKKKN